MDHPLLLQAYSQLLIQLEELPVFLRKTLAGLPAEAWGRLPAEDGSPLLEHVWHVHDCETDLYGMRIRRVLSEERPLLPPMSVSGWPAERAYHLRDGEAGIAAFAAQRAELLAQLKRVEPAQLGRAGVRGDGTEVNLLGLVEQLAEHDRDHRWRVAAILRGYAGL
ncbi:DinB family protein [Chromobacterium alticapitis]|uniref:DinB family protein n=1 Tax=Chromobacterium alticapitis TaxID=2073169 RepID=UPI001E4DB097|nr:DinB family protein [Chromobacterium alticapitis]